MANTVVSVPIANLRRSPVRNEGRYTQDPLQESQLLFGESVRVLEEENAWVKIEALDQPRFSAGEWGYYPGWVEKDQIAEVEDGTPLVQKLFWHEGLSVGSKLVGIEKQGEAWVVAKPGGGQMTVPDSVFEGRESGMSWLGSPYLWGGCSAFTSDALSGVDCSGLVHLLYRSWGMAVPRDAHDQSLMAEPLKGNEVETNDLIFLSPDNDRVDHVMLYAGHGLLLEATMASNNVRLISCTERLGCGLSEIGAGQKHNGYWVTCGSFLRRKSRVMPIPASTPSSP